MPLRVADADSHRTIKILDLNLYHFDEEGVVVRGRLLIRLLGVDHRQRSEIQCVLLAVLRLKMLWIRQVALQLVLAELDLITVPLRSDVVGLAKNDEVFLGLLVQSLAELRHVQNEWSQEVLVDAKHAFEAAVDENGADESLKDIAHDLARLKKFYLSAVQLEIFPKRVPDVAIRVVI